MPGLILPSSPGLILPPSLVTPANPPSVGPGQIYGEDFLDRIVAVHWRTGARPTAFYGTYIVVLTDGSSDVVLAASNNGIDWNFWSVPQLGGRTVLFTIGGGPGSGGFTLQAAGYYEPADSDGSEQAVLFHSTNGGQSWFDNTPSVDGDAGDGTEIDGGGYSYGARAAIATTWASGGDSGAFNTVMMFQGGWQTLAAAPDPDDGGYEFPDAPIPPDTICYGTAGGGFNEFPASFYDPIETICPYLGPLGARGFYSGGNNAIGPPGYLSGGPPFILTTVDTLHTGQNLIDVDVDQLNGTGLINDAMIFASNFPLP